MESLSVVIMPSGVPADLGAGASLGDLSVGDIRHLNGVVNHQRKPQSIVLLLASLNLIEKKKDCFQQK